MIRPEQPGDLLSMELIAKSKVVQVEVKTTADYPFSNTQILIDTDRKRLAQGLLQCRWF